MDDRGNWHHQQKAEQRIGEAMGERPAAPLRAVIEIAIGETVKVVKSDQTFLAACFDAAEKNRVTLTPIEGPSPRPYLELAERVQLVRENGEAVAAQVWDNRGGRLILRTLPIGQ